MYIYILKNMSTETYKRDLQKRLTKEICGHGKRPTKETYEKCEARIVTATHCNTHCNRHRNTHCIKLNAYTATHCNTLQHT